MKNILLVLLYGFSVNCATIEICTTPDSLSGMCIPIRSCNSMVSFLISKENFTENERKFLVRYRCGFDKDGPKICCPSNGDVVDKIIINTSRIQTTVDEGVKNHQNEKLLPSECGLGSQDSDRIISGDKTGVFDFPWMALLEYRTDRGSEYKCGGTIISDRYILTAAHCFLSTLFQVRIGEHSIKKLIECEVDDDNKTTCADPAQDILVEKVISHEMYGISNGGTNDIGLIRLAQPITFSKSVQAICLPVDPDVAADLNKVQTMIVTGWGTTNLTDSNGKKSDELLKASLRIFPFDECQNIYKQRSTGYKVTENNICANNKNGSDSCQGDSGGPLQVVLPRKINKKSRFVQAGIVSFGPKTCGQENFPGVYTKVNNYVKWILDNMKE